MSVGMFWCDWLMCMIIFVLKLRKMFFIYKKGIKLIILE